MGCDGGTIPTRDELVKLKKKPEQADKHMARMAKWLHCAITQEPLREPIVTCELGRLYNKESILEYLLDKSTCDSADHIRTLKDTRVLNLTENPVFGDRAKKVNKGGYVDLQAVPFICPVIGIEMNGLYKFCMIWTCGCVISEKALKEVKSAVCHKCGVPFNNDEIILNGSKEDVDKLRDNMEAKRARIKAEKKAKKSQKRKLEENGTSTATSDGTKDEPSLSKSATDRLTNGEASGSKETNGSAASSSKVKKLTNGSASSKLPNGKAASNGTVYSNQEFNPKNSEVYKSLFLTKDSKATDAHWVTYNPYYAMRK